MFNFVTHLQIRDEESQRIKRTSSIQNQEKLHLGGRRVIGIFDCDCQECSAVAEYINNTEDPFTTIIKK